MHAPEVIMAGNNPFQIEKFESYVALFNCRLHHSSVWCLCVQLYLVLDDKLKTIFSKNSGGEKKRFFDNKTQNNNLKFYNFYLVFLLSPDKLFVNTR